MLLSSKQMWGSGNLGKERRLLQKAVIRGGSFKRVTWPKLHLCSAVFREK